MKKLNPLLWWDKRSVETREAGTFVYCLSALCLIVWGLCWLWPHVHCTLWIYSLGAISPTLAISFLGARALMPDKMKLALALSVRSIRGTARLARHIVWKPALVQGAIVARQPLRILAIATVLWY